MKELFYTVEKETEMVNDTEVCTGMKSATVYEIALDKPHNWFTVELPNKASTPEAIDQWLNDNGFGDKSYTLRPL